MNEKYEKAEEKELSKQEEKSSEEKYYGEKEYEEKYRRDPLGTIIWAVILIWAGLVFMANNLGYLEIFQPVLDMFPNFGKAWDIDVPFLYSDSIQIFLIGLVLILAVEILIRLLVPEYRRPIFGSLVFLGVVLSFSLGRWDFFFPILLIAFGISILIRKK
ncbi:MAG: hypothetical protein PVF83_18625 [Anaerolineales bacterium]|jgi:hypothetical protein